MIQRTWSGAASGYYFNGANWVGGVAPGAGDTALIEGTGAAPVGIGGIYGIDTSNPLVDLYDPTLLPPPGLTGDPDPAAVAAEIGASGTIAGQTIAANGGTALVGFGMVDSTLAATSALTVTGVAVVNGEYTNALAGTINVEPTGAPPDSHGNDGELVLDIFPVGSVDPNTETRRDYTPWFDNTGTTSVAAGSGLVLGFQGAAVSYTTIDGIPVALGGYDAFINQGLISLADSSLDIDAGFVSGGNGYNIFLNDGTVDLGPANVAHGRATIDAELDGTGTITVAGTGTARAAAYFDGGDNGNTVNIADADVEFYTTDALTSSYAGALNFTDAAGHLTVNQNSLLPFLPIGGFRTGDQITVSAYAFQPDQFNHGFVATPGLTWNQAAQTLTITATDFYGDVSTVGTLTLAGAYTQPEFHAVAFGGSGSIGNPDYLSPSVTISLACFAAGTRITTPRGAIPVEELSAGDEVVTASGAVRPVTWTGSRHVDLDAEPDHRPVRVRAHALGALGPTRDLLLSPDHALLIDGVLIPVRLLVNHRSILVANDMPRITYFHLELPTHDILLAEGAPAESFLDTGHRAAFIGAGPLASPTRDRARLSCAPLALDPATVEPIWRRIASHAASLAEVSLYNPELYSAVGAATKSKLELAHAAP